MKGFILAGGEGTRLYPLTLEMPKPLITVGKVPILTYLVNLFLKHGVNDIKMNVQEKHLEDFEKWKIKYFPKEKIEFIVEQKPSGTFTPLAEKSNGDWFSESIVVSNGDELKELDLTKMIEWHKKKNAFVTVGLVKVENPQDYGVAVLKEDKIIEFIEKPKDPPSSYINCGLYIMNPGIKQYFPQGAEFAMIETDLFPRLAKEGKLFGYKWEGKWTDCGTFKRWGSAIKNWNKN
jgi:NDP-sugar pyrophosphorylase family protein